MDGVWDHINIAAGKAIKLVATLTRVMPNINGPSESKRRGGIALTNSIMLYGYETWGDALKINKYRKRMSRL